MLKLCNVIENNVSFVRLRGLLSEEREIHFPGLRGVDMEGKQFVFDYCLT